ncbi:flagellar filament capping protein FliD [Arcobacter roscoffensis]|uniref:Flagellar hook-associated protein 2 n=1 Tax=Arcobacter roscoffensis TaxID=2961520 RepID=A0ABY5E5B8_9BACT|nr:flagellar filament capping protein FliD [Arcobacter roscoffensis]UTJ06258.1 flagellar filament capping protein FliD [Arcobacter roscoffensis]
MAEGILGLGTGQSTALNQDLIDKLKAAERRAQVEPLETDLEDIVKEKETFATIDAKVNELLAAIKPFDLFVTSGSNAFEEKSATTSGDSVVFNATDSKNVNTGITTVDVKGLAQKDVYQSDAINGATKDALGDIGTLSIEVDGTTHTFDTSTYATYDELATAINDTTGINASLDQVGDDSYRLVLKSESSGLANALTISGAASQALGYTTDGTTTNATNHTLTAQNMSLEVDGVAYSSAENKITVDGLDITATKEGVSSINVSKDTSLVETQITDFISKYNELVDLVGTEIDSADSAIADKSSLRTMLSQIKEKFFGEYGENSDKSLFNYGFELDKTGKISLDLVAFNKVLSDNPEELKDIFVGTAAKEGFGTQLKATLDEMNFTGGLLDAYEKGIDSREETLEKEKEKSIEKLDDKYSQLANQFAAYTALITQFESSFSGLKMMIQQSTTS